MDLNPADVDPLIERLFTLAGVTKPVNGSVCLNFGGGMLQTIEPKHVIRVRREKPVAPPDRDVHTQRRTHS